MVILARSDTFAVEVSVWIAAIPLVSRGGGVYTRAIYERMEVAEVIYENYIFHIRR